jgi:hypothetical protein
MNAKQWDADLVLRRLAEIRELIPLLNGSPLHPSEDLAYVAVGDGIASLATDLGTAVRATLERRRAASWKVLLTRRPRR